MEHTLKRDQEFKKAIVAGVACASILAIGIYAGSGGLKHFDPALFWYAIGSLAGAFAVGYRFTFWSSRPPTWMYFKRACQLLMRRGPAFEKRSAVSNSLPELELAKATGRNYVGQSMIRRRSWFRWIMHLCLSGGCTLAFAVTFPLVFGWVHFETPIENAGIYNVAILGEQVDSFHVGSIKAGLIFNALNIAGIVVMIGLAMVSFRRLTDAGERAVQTFYEDILPLILIAAVTLTGLALTVSYKFMGGQGHGSLVWVHMVTVIVLILYIPFGKLFHMFQRTVSLCVSMYKKAGKDEVQATCRITNEEYASRRHVEDLKIVLDQLDFDYRLQGADGETVHYQDISPKGRRRLVAFNQGRTLGR